MTSSQTCVGRLLLIGTLLMLTHEPIAAQPARPARVSMAVVEGLAHPSLHVAAFNDQGTIVGCLAAPDSTASAPFLWTPHSGVQFFLGSATGCAHDVNNAGTVVGTLERPDGTFSGFLWSLRHGLVELESMLPATINNRGQVAGTCLIDGREGPCVWEGGRLTLLFPNEPGFHGSAAAINDPGHVTGEVRSGGTFRAFVWSARTGLRLLPSGSDDPLAITAGLAISNSGEVVGFLSTNGRSQPVHWTREGTPTILPLAAGSATAINAAGLFAGRYAVFTGERNEWVGFARRSPHGLVHLGFGIPVAVNARGDILGSTTVNGVTTAVIWTVRP